MTATHKKPQIERELKFAGVDLDQLRSRLLELECERLGTPPAECCASVRTVAAR